MRNKRKIKLILITLGIFIAVVGITNYSSFNDQDGTVDNRDEDNLTRLKRSAGYTENFIHIDGITSGNWTGSTGYPWCYIDNGVYIIENVTIDASASPTGSGILINNSQNEDFIIRNCTVYNAGSGGIRLENTNNGSLINNTCTSNDQYGIILHNNCINNIIFDNVVNDTMGHGILLREFCENNIVSGNNVRNSNQHGIHIRESSSSNSILGNIVNNNGWNGIRVRYSSKNNNISGNTVSNNGWEGIYLDQNCDNNLILGNNVTHNGRDGGIYLEYDCHNNNISGNTINDNYLGLCLYANCDNNTISGNLLENNLNYGIILATANYNLLYQNSLIGTGIWHAIDNGLNNHWNNSIVGNYWDNHTSPDSNNDGIVDSPYTWIMLSAESKDYFPLVESPIHLGEKVHIDDSGVSAWNWSKTARCKVWCTGSGTYNDPYIIDGLEIDGESDGSCILIGNSSVYFIIKDCKVYNSGSGSFPYYGSGICLSNTNNGALENNNCSNNYYNGIYLYSSYNNSISGNIANDNRQGIYLRQAYNNTISRNTINNNHEQGIDLSLSHYNTISGNTANNNDMGIILSSCDNNKISGNTANDNHRNNEVGIWLVQSDNNSISENIFNRNKFGIYFSTSCFYNNISGNNLNSNYEIGIYLSSSDNTTISGNSVNNNNYIGIRLFSCDYTMILGNTANYNKENGIFLSNSVNTTISGNSVNNNNYIGIRLLRCDYTMIMGNSITNNSGFGIYLEDSDNNEIVEDNIYFNLNSAIAILTKNCDDNIITRNILLSKEIEFIFDNGTNTVISLNYYGSVPPSFIVDGITQSFSDMEFIITFNSTSETGFGTWEQSIQIWWNGIVVPSNNIIALGDNLYNVSLTPIFVDPGDSPILLNMTISAIHHLEKYFETYIAVEPYPDIEPCDIIKLLQVEITEHSYSLEHFNFTFFVFNETGHGIDAATIQMWWNGNEISDSVINLGNGLYFVSLEPITVTPGEDPILLKMIVSASGYEDLQFETYLAVDPDVLKKEAGKRAGEVPLVIIIIAITSTSAGIAVATATIFLLRKRKRTSEVI